MIIDGIYEAAQRSNDGAGRGYHFPEGKPGIRWGFWIRTIATLAILIGCVALMVIGAATLMGTVPPA